MGNIQQSKAFSLQMSIMPLAYATHRHEKCVLTFSLLVAHVFLCTLTELPQNVIWKHAKSGQTRQEVSEKLVLTGDVVFSSFSTPS